MVKILNTHGLNVSKSPVNFETYDIIRYDASHPLASVELTMSGMGTVDLSDELGSVSATVHAANSGNTITTGAGNDTLLGGNKVDYLYGGVGNDSINGGGGADLLAGGDGNDELYDISGSNTFLGGAGNDHITANSGGFVDGGDGIDTLTVWGSGIHYMSIFNVEILDTNGVTVTASMEQFDAFDSIVNNQSPTAAAELNMLNGGFLDLRDELGSRDVIIWGAGSACEIITGAGNDTIHSSIGNDIYHGDLGDDAIDGYEGNDRLFGDDGNDELYGGLGSDYLDGGSGNDRLYGGAGDDSLLGGLGNDTVYVSTGTDVADGGTGADILDFSGLTTSGITFNLNSGSWSGFGADLTFKGFEGVTGTDGNDTITGWRTSDRISGGAGNDWLIGGGGNDKLQGGAGDDLIDGGDGNDSLDGGDGNDTFIVSVGQDVIHGKAGIDILDFSAFASIGAELNLTTGDFSHGVVHTTFTNIEGVTGTGGDDVIIGSQLAGMFLSGGAGNDLLVTGAGNDVLTGGSGADTFQFRFGSGLGTVTDFSHADDGFRLEASSFHNADGSALSAGALAAHYVVISGSDTLPSSPGSAHGYLLATATGLYWDDDGSGANAAVQIAAINPTTNLALDDFLFV